MKGHNERVVGTAWYTENFSRAGKKFKDLNEYLSPPTPAEKKRGLLEMFQRMKLRQKGA